MKDHLQAIITVLSLVNPAICAVMFSQLEAGRPRGAQLADSAKVVVMVLAILTLAALFGVRVLDVFGVSLDAFKVAGGGVLSWIGFNMLRGDSPHSSASKADPPNAPPSLTTLILFAASPGTITGVITLAAAQTGRELPVATLVAVAVAVVVTWCVMLIIARIGEAPRGDGLVRETVTRFMGLIVIAMGIQFVLTGYRTFMATAV